MHSITFPPKPWAFSTPTNYHNKHLMSCQSTQSSTLGAQNKTLIYNWRFMKIDVIVSLKKYLHSPLPIPLSSDTTFNYSHSFFSFPIVQPFRRGTLYSALLSASHQSSFVMQLQARKQILLLIILMSKATVFQYWFSWHPWIMSH